MLVLDNLAGFGVDIANIYLCTLLGTNISPLLFGTFESMIFPFPFCGI